MNWKKIIEWPRGEGREYYKPWWAIIWHLIWFIPIYVSLIILCIFMCLSYGLEKAVETWKYFN